MLQPFFNIERISYNFDWHQDNGIYLQASNHVPKSKNSPEMAITMYVQVYTGTPSSIYVVLLS